MIEDEQSAHRIDVDKVAPINEHKLINPLPLSFDFGFVCASETLTREAGINPPPFGEPWPVKLPANVSAQITADTSGGLFQATKITSYNINVDFEPGLDRLVEDKHDDGSHSLAVSRFQAIGVSVSFSSAGATSDGYTATLLIHGDTWTSPKTFPLSVQILDIPPPILNRVDQSTEAALVVNTVTGATVRVLLYPHSFLFRPPVVVGQAVGTGSDTRVPFSEGYTPSQGDRLGAFNGS